MKINYDTGKQLQVHLIDIFSSCNSEILHFLFAACRWTDENRQPANMCDARGTNDNCFLLFPFFAFSLVFSYIFFYWQWIFGHDLISQPSLLHWIRSTNFWFMLLLLSFLKCVTFCNINHYSTVWVIRWLLFLSLYIICKENRRAAYKILLELFRIAIIYIIIW